MSWSQSDLNAFNARRFKQPPASGGVEKESELQEAIIAEVRRRGWIAFYSRMDKPTTARIGQPDFIVLGDHGRVFLVEAKRKGGKLTEEQLALKAWAAKLGHEIHTVYSMDEFALVITTFKP